MDTIQYHKKCGSHVWRSEGHFSGRFPALWIGRCSLVMWY